MSNKHRKFLTLDELVTNRYVPQRTKEALYKVLVRSRLLRPENGFYQWGINGIRKPVWVLDERFVSKLQDIFLRRNIKER